MERGWEFSDSDTDCDLETQPVVKKQRYTCALPIFFTFSFLACFRTVVEYSDSDTDLSTDNQSFKIESPVEILRYGYTQRNSVFYCQWRNYGRAGGAVAPPPRFLKNRKHINNRT